MAVCALALFKKVDPTLKVLLAGLGGLTVLYFSKSILGTGGVLEPLLAPLPVDLTETMAGLARIPVCAGATMTAFFP